MLSNLFKRHKIVRDNLSSRKGASSPFLEEKKHHSILKRIIIGVVAFIIVAGGIFIYRITSIGENVFSNNGSFLGQIKELVFGGGKELKTNDGQTNILVIGIGGEKHKGGELADTIMVVAIKEKDKKIATLSIPRDLYVKLPSSDNYYTKINAVHAYGELKEKGSGPKEMIKIVEETTGLKIHYFGRIDFIAFKKIIDELDGIDITIEESFYDYWHQISFMKGTEHMNGERALAYVRARYVEGPEGGDIARGKRTQQVLQAIAEKAVKIPVWDIKTVNNIIGALGNHAQTNLHLSQLKYLYELSKQFDTKNIINAIMSTGPNGILKGETENLGGQMASVLKTRTGDYSEIRELARDLFNQKMEFNKTTVENEKAPEEEIKKEEERKATLDIRNGTAFSGLAGKVAEVLKKEGFEIKNISNAESQNNEKTVIYDFTGGKKPLSLGIIENKLGTANIKTALPENEEKSEVEIVIILGDDAVNKF